MGTRVTTEGTIVGCVRRQGRSGTRQDGSTWETSQATFLLLAQSWDDYAARVSISDAQAAELDNPELFGRVVSVTGNLVTEGRSQIIECGSFDIAPETEPV